MLPYIPLLILFLIGAVFTVGFWVATTYLGRNKKPNPEKNAPFECGSESTGGRLKLSVKFYLTAILFVVFDIEAVFVYPWAIHFRDLGWTGFVEMVSFLAVIIVALVYVWKKGALEWET